MPQPNNHIDVANLSPLGTDSPPPTASPNSTGTVDWSDMIGSISTTESDGDTTTEQSAAGQLSSEPPKPSTDNESTHDSDSGSDRHSSIADPDGSSGGDDTDRDADSDTADTDSDTADTDSDTADTEPADPPLPLDQVFGILKNERRRRVLIMLDEADGKLSLSDLAEQIAAWENDKPIKQITSDERKRVYVGLYQCHLPKMDGMGVIDFNKPRGIIELGDNMDIMYRYLDTDESAEEPPWHRYSVLLSAGGASVLTLALLARPMTALPVLDMAVVGLLVVFGVYGLACLNWSRKHDTPAE